MTVAMIVQISIVAVAAICTLIFGIWQHRSDRNRPVNHELVTELNEESRYWK